MPNTKKDALKIVFVLRAAGEFSRQRSLIDALCNKGNKVHLLYGPALSTNPVSREAIRSYALGEPKFTHDFARERRSFLFSFLRAVRELRSYREYLFMGEQSVYYRRRAARATPQPIRLLVYTLELTFANTLLKMKAVGILLALVERHTPASHAIRKHLNELKADAVIATPANKKFSSPDIEYLKAARALGIPSVVPVFSWDNLTTKGLIHIQPNLLLAWNERHRNEAIRFHHIPPERIRLTGAPPFDIWLSITRPTTTRKEFCARNGLDQNKPIVLYIASSKNIANDEADIVRGLRIALDRADNAELRGIQLLMRPYPGRHRQYLPLLSAGIIVLPRVDITDPAISERLYADTLFHATAAIGINTSGMLDAMIVGKPVIAYMSEKHRDTQERTLHFRQLLEHDTLEQAHAPEECVDALEDILAGSDTRREQRERFVAHFIFPCGREQTAGERAAEEIIRLAQNAPRISSVRA